MLRHNLHQHQTQQVVGPVANCQGALLLCGCLCKVTETSDDRHRMGVYKTQK